MNGIFRNLIFLQLLRLLLYTSSIIINQAVILRMYNRFLPLVLQLMLAENPEVGCGAFNCRILGNGSTRVSDVTLLICNYLRTYVSPALPFRDGDVCSACPVGSPVCVRKGLCGESRLFTVVCLYGMLKHVGRKTIHSGLFIIPLHCCECVSFANSTS